VPTPPPVAEVLRVAVGFSIGTDLTARYRFFVQYSGTAPTDAVCAAIAAAVETDFVTPFLGYCGPWITFTSVDVVDLTGPSAGAAEITFSHAGSRAGVALPAGVAFLLNFGIARRYRGGKPRVYLPVGADGDVATSQTWAGGFVTLIEGQWATSMAAFSGTVFTGTTIGSQVNVPLYHSFTSHQNPVTLRWRNIPSYAVGPIVPDVITSVTGNPKFGSQRRRNQHSS